MFDLLITGGKVVSPMDTNELDIAIEGREIVALAKPGYLGNKAKRVIDASGFYLLPGGIDPHTHVHDEWQGRPVPGWDVASVAAAHGGTTTFIDFARSIETTIQEAITQRQAEAAGRVAVDYALHATLVPLCEASIKEVANVRHYGVPSIKIHMHERAGEPAEDGPIFNLFKEAARQGCIVAIHAENPSLISYFTNKLLAEGKRSVQFFPQGRPNIVEAEAVRRIIFLAEQAGAAIYFVHLSSREAIKSVAEAKAKNLPVYCETCPHYLAFNDEVYSQERAIQFIRFPPIRSAADQAALWKGVVNGTIDCIGTDHSAAYLSLKRELSEGKSFNEVPGGMGQIENRVPFMYSEGVASGRISVNRLVELVSTNPAKLFGLYPKKGIVGAGSDADIVMFDPKPRKKITFSDLHMGLDYSIYEGWTFTGTVVATILKGKIIVEGGQYLGSLQDGDFVKRRVAKEILTVRSKV